MKMSLMNNTILHLLNFEKYSSFPQALEGAAKANNFQVVLLSSDFNPLVCVETRHLVRIEDAIHRYKSVGVVADGGAYRMVEVGGVLSYWGIIDILNNRYHLLLTDDGKEFQEEEYVRLAEIIELAMGMWKFTPERDAKAEFVRAMIRGNMELAYSIAPEAAVDPQNIISVFCVKGYETGRGDDILRKFSQQNDLRTYVVQEEDRVYGVIANADRANSRIDAENRASLITLFDELKEQNTIRIYHVTGLDGLDGAADAFKMISETVPFVGNVFPFKRVFSKYELVLISNCIAIRLEGGRLLKNYMDVLAPFKKDSSSKAKQLLETLETFILDAGMNSAKTANIMQVHTNTVQYRLKKINEILGIDIMGNRVIPGLTIAIALHRFEKTNK